VSPHDRPAGEKARERPLEIPRGRTDMRTAVVSIDRTTARLKEYTAVRIATGSDATQAGLQTGSLQGVHVLIAALSRGWRATVDSSPLTVNASRSPNAEGGAAGVAISPSAQAFVNTSIYRLMLKTKKGRRTWPAPQHQEDRKELPGCPAHSVGGAGKGGPPNNGIVLGPLSDPGDRHAPRLRDAGRLRHLAQARHFVAKGGPRRRERCVRSDQLETTPGEPADQRTSPTYVTSSMQPDRGGTSAGHNWPAAGRRRQDRHHPAG